MEKVYSGRIKDILKDKEGNVFLYFKDQVADEQGMSEVDTVAEVVDWEGAGESRLKSSIYFFNLLDKIGVPHHFIEADLDERLMKVKPATVFGHGTEVFARHRAMGTFYRRFDKYLRRGEELKQCAVEVKVKDPYREKAIIALGVAEALGIFTKEEYNAIEEIALKVAQAVKEDLAQYDLELYDIKLEMGRLEDGTVAVIDEIAGEDMRVFKGPQFVPADQLVKHLGL
ncbi:phosphoribosylaminoimidazolesuccinocarboxamide synthase [Dolosicoccus paucivorans]|uniref:phosphoribosylaminoimidazolesuccinocarboxamide synthase n=1 Tax=Dolosicoccus paucivorans TaxID=84521 RepID=UPI000884E7DB|nr:phosphoribosylaminoimidazolesuccinocarboxamide synthase [Dolosicoccus paucivorans]SDI36127.1 phosphoribosylaminoimidazole-succinocarboxamide synthase [Dolosicoccus paucivorans]